MVRRLARRSRHRSVLVGIAAATIAFLPHVAHAQASVSAYAGAEFDNETNWLLFGGEVRVPLVASPVAPWDGQLRATYHPYGSDVSTLQIDVNALMPLVLAHPGRFKPFVGAGLAALRYHAGDESDDKVGLNLVAGTSVELSPTSPVFGLVQTQYTLVRDYPNSYTAMFGFGFHFGESSRTRR